jgi:4-oxalocrotonate tautomerase
MPLIEIRLLRGRTTEQKQDLLRAVHRAVRESIGAPDASIRIWIHELAPEEYSAGGRLKSEAD